MTLTSGTVVTYPSGAVSSRGTVVHVADAGEGRSAVVLDRTAFHPVDTAWPDQPADRGTLRVGAGELAVVDAVVGATQGDGLLLGPDVPVRTGTEGWTFVVAHIVEDGAAIAAGDTVEVTVDAGYRAALSAGHTACHLASLALDAALAGAWRKQVQTDALGAPAFDALAIQESRILPDGSRDVYRIGKSLRRKGFDPEALADLADLAARISAQLAEWIAAGGAVRIEREGDTLADRRAWVCELPADEARIPCGGTHLASLRELAAATVAFTSTPVEGGLELVMTTTAERA
ncbi:metal-dependent hydrolase [Microbacterium trichothecenolyticum]|uniref:metal-dependent hydrolase n=1 Tax=Microbacterium trichothecenolyticum TaxID=69370 RepID=UPI001C6EAB4F|nr:metal-dependent hydrolase [Microbacterium trichothecenolyticum]MBW9119368.1 metal-dependent hydrolase [Microbacterium trichothecenolyticum]